MPTLNQADPKVIVASLDHRYPFGGDFGDSAGPLLSTES